MSGFAFGTLNELRSEGCSTDVAICDSVHVEDFPIPLAVCPHCLVQLVTILRPLRHGPFNKTVVISSTFGGYGTLRTPRYLHGVANSFFLIILSSSLLSLHSLLSFA